MAFQSSLFVHFNHSLSAPPAAFEIFTARMRSLFNHLRKSECQLEVNAVKTRSLTPKKAQIVEERNHRKSKGRSTAQRDLASWAKTKFRLDAPPTQPVKRFFCMVFSCRRKNRNGKEKKKRQTSRDGSVVGSMGFGINTQLRLIKTQGLRI